jgi:hypothetical protein
MPHPRCIGHACIGLALLLAAALPATAATLDVGKGRKFAS